MFRSQLLSLALSAVFVLAFAGCSTDSTTSENSGSLNLNLELAPGVTINEVDWTISGGEMEDMTGTIDTSAPGATASVEVFGLPPGDGYTVTLEATDESAEVSCKGEAEFGVEVGVSTAVMVFLNCKIPTNLGGVRVNGKFNICAQVAKVVVSPLQTSLGNDITLLAQAVDTEGDEVSFEWTASGGSIGDASAADTSYTCEEVGEQSITITVSDDPDCMDDWTVAVTCVDGDGGMGGSGGDGGAGGQGGMGGAPAGTASVTAAHFAPEVPSAEDTAVAIYVNGEEVTALGTIEYGETTGRVELPAPGTYDIGIGLPGGDGPLLELSGVELSDGDDIAAAAYRTNETLPVALFAYNLSTDGLEAGSGRVYVSHGANDPVLDPVDIIVTDEGACPPPLLDELAFGETRAEGGIDLPAASYNLGFDLAPGDCTAEVPFVAPVTEAVTSILVAVDEDTGPGLAPQVWALVDAETVVALITPNACDNVVCEDTDCTEGVCVPETGSCVDQPINEGGDCESGTGTCDTGMCVPNVECNINDDCGMDEVCVANACVSDPDLFCDVDVCATDDAARAACVETFLVCLEAEPANEEECILQALTECDEEVVYSQDFESLDQTSGTALGDAEFLVFGNEFLPDGTPIQGYGPFPAPNGTPGFCSIALGQGGDPQGDQVLVIYSDYNNNANQEAGNLVEANTFQEPFSNPDSLITAADLGTYTFSFDAKRGDINDPTLPRCDPGSTEYTPNPPCDSTAVAFVKTLDPAAGFATTNNITLPMTAIPDTWNRYSITIVVDGALIGQLLQFGFAATATNFEPSGVFYDNLLVTVE